MKHYEQDIDNSDEEDTSQLPHIQKRYKKKVRPITITLIDTQYDVVQQVCWDLDYNIVMERDPKNWDVKWTDSAVPIDLLSKMQSHQKINHFPGMNTLSRKNNLAKNLVKMQSVFPEHYQFFPKTFLLPSDLSAFRAYFAENRKRGREKTFIVKPEASCQGRGIFLSQSQGQIESSGQCVVQNYIDNPLLYKGLKFDFRIYVLVAGCDPLRLYIYNEGLVRFATEKYEPASEDNFDNLYMHLTNYAINKDNPKYVFNESLQNLSLGHKKSLAQFFQTLKTMGLPAHEYWSGIKETIVKTLISGVPHLQHQYRMAQQNNFLNNMCFQILGFDFMIDDLNKLYLLQINYTPSFSTETPIDHLIKSNLIRDTLILMNVTPSARDRALKEAKEVVDRRVFTGKINKISPEQRQRIVRQLQKERDEYEKKHLGSFEKIYPSRNEERQAKYLSLLEYSHAQYKDSTSPQKIAHSRRSSSKYRIKKIMSNYTITEDQKETRQNKIRIKPAALSSQYDHADHKTYLSKKLKERLTQGGDNNSQVSPESMKGSFKVAKGEEVKGMLLSDLDTANGQKTMFSKGFNNVETAA